MKGMKNLKINDPVRSTAGKTTRRAGKKEKEDALIQKDVVNLSEVKGDAFLAGMEKLRTQSALLSARSGEVKTGEVFKSGFVTDFVDGKQVDDKMLELAKAYPDLVSIVTRDYQTSGYDGKIQELRGPAPLRYMRIGKKDVDKSDKPGVLLLAAPHAREVMQPMIMLETAQQLLANYNPESDDPKIKEISDLMDSLDIYIVPVTNPDGLNFALYDDPVWRKTRCKIPGSKEQGVDANRNYDYNWEAGDPGSNVYGGPYPFSEPESRHAASIVDEHPNIKFVADFHSRGNEIRRPIGVKDKNDLKYYKYIQQRIQDTITGSRGIKYDMVESKVVHGTSDDYFYYKKGAYAFVIEDGLKFKPPLQEALGIVAECTEGAKELLRVAREYGEKNK